MSAEFQRGLGWSRPSLSLMSKYCLMILLIKLTYVTHSDLHNVVTTSRSIRTFLVLQQWRNLGGRFGTREMHLGPWVAWAAVRSRTVVLLLLTFCLLLLPLWESVIVLCFVVRYFVSILVLRSS